MADKQILHLIEILKQKHVITYGTEFCEAIGLKKQNLYKIQNGKSHFTPEQIEKVIKIYKVNANWIFGVSDEIYINLKKENFEHVQRN